MTTSAAPSAPLTSALVRHDPRPFLVQAIDRCLKTNVWEIADLEVLTIDLVNMAFRYLSRHEQDLRDLEAVGDAAEIVCLHVDDGLRALSQNDLDRAATLLASAGQPLLSAFRQSWGTFDQLRHEAEQFHSDLRDIRVGSRGHEIALHPMPVPLLKFGSEHGFEDYTDAALLEVWRRGGSVAAMRERLRDGIALAVRQYALLKLLSFLEVTAHWRELLISDGTFSFSAQGAQLIGLAYDLGWASALIRAVERQDIGLVVTTNELERFLNIHLHSNDEGTYVDDEALAMAARVLIPPLTAALGQPADEDVRYALEYSASHIASVHRTSGGEDERERPIQPRSGRWLIRWGLNVAFLLVSKKEHELAVRTVVGPMDQHELVDRFEGTIVPLTAEERREMLRQMDLARLPGEDLIRVLEASPHRAKAILRRAKLEQRPIAELETLAMADLTHASARHSLAEAVVCSGEDLSSLSEDAVFALLRKLSPAIESLRALIAKARVTPERLLKAFRNGEDRNTRQEWVRLAVVSPEHLVHLISDVRSFPDLASDVVATFRGPVGWEEDAVWIPIGITARCLLEAEQVRRKRSAAHRHRPLLDQRGEAMLLDPDLQWLMSQLPEYQRAAIRRAFRRASRPVKRRRRQAKTH